ncbi:MAG TPA: hypothetical protein VFZ26_01720 [Gemmatimonadales bacterium]
MPGRLTWPAAALLWLAAAGALAAQETPNSPPRRLLPAETGCDTTAAPAADSVYDADSVDQPVEPVRLPVEDMPLRVREVLRGRSVFRFVVEPSGRIDRCSIALVDETSREWTGAVLEELRVARYRPARKAGRPVRQVVHQIFTYHSDGRLQRPR